MRFGIILIALCNIVIATHTGHLVDALLIPFLLSGLYHTWAGVVRDKRP